MGPQPIIAVPRPDADFWHGRRVLLTGYTGFKGGWLALWLQKMGATVTGVALSPTTQPNLYSLARVGEGMTGHICDIRDAPALWSLAEKADPEIVLHLAAQPLVRTSYRDPVPTFATNMMGTVHVLDVMRRLNNLRAAVMITTDKVYRDQDVPYPYRESDALGGFDPYSASKAAAEMVIASYRDAFLRKRNIAVASARAGNVIGGGDWSEDRLIPDAMRAFGADLPLSVRSPDAIRPWQHVLEPLNSYLVLAERLWSDPELAGSYNFGPQTHDAASVREVVEVARAAYGKGEVHWGVGEPGPHETKLLTLEIAKARSVLGIRPRWNAVQAVQRAVRWYRAAAGGTDARDLCFADLADYLEA